MDLGDRRGGQLLILGSVLMVVAAVVHLTASPAKAAQVAVSGSWYWAEQPDPLPQPVGTVPLPHPDVPANDMAVAIKNGAPDKVSYLSVDFGSTPPGSKVTRAVLTAKEDPAAVNINQPAAKIVAEPAKGFVAAGSAGAPLSQAPGANGSGPKAKGVRDSKGTWTFDVTELLAAEVGGTIPANGIALIPDTNSDNFQTVWHGPTILLDVTAAPPGAAINETTSAAVPPAVTTPPAVGDLSGSLGGALGSASPPDLSPSSSTASAPIVAAPSAAPPTATRIKLSHHARPGLTLPFAIALAGISLLAIGSSIALGERGEPAERRQGSVLRRIEHRPTGKE